MKIAIYYTSAELTPWKENVNRETLHFVLAHMPTEWNGQIVECLGCDDLLLTKLKEFDVLFNLSYGYDQMSQVDMARWLEGNGLVHTASSANAMELAQDKALLPDLCRILGYSTPKILNNLEELEPETFYLSKPRFGSCHRQIQIFKGREIDLFSQVCSSDFILQPYVFGREFSVAVIPDLNDHGLKALPAVEIVPSNAQNLYIAGQEYGPTRRVFDPLLLPETYNQLQEQALNLHIALGLRGMSRTDFRVDHMGRLFVLDINAMPNFDPNRSLLPALCSQYSVDFTLLIRLLVERSIQASSNQSEEEREGRFEAIF